jgi:hypothetical protein
MISTRSVWFLHAECNFYTQSVISTRSVIYKCDYDTHDCDFHTHKSEFYTQSVILTRMSVVMTRTTVINTRTMMRVTLKRKITKKSGLGFD